ncbi:alkaline phosphatase family protein [Mesorhizobium sp. VK9D]|uniref:alkaline phosphatase family protein n=1 Tax=Mesorhizobium australafricanum TaxID=3072311 RepID=UPI002A244B3B|nr:alkaline phosphatase family protein [Mesorhizobium sp. VK9D]MDX8456326.1 alkaline phosphatase family protein [Mesorhizobium sp. VK9D]
MTTSSQITTLFSGISDTSTDPPHNALAVGPNYIVMAEGSRIEWTGLSGGAANLQSVYRFFGSLGSTAASGLFDPRAVYDSVNQRYVVTMDNLGSNGAVSNIDIAVSKDSNPNDGWYFYSLNTSLTINGQLTAADQPILSVDGTNIYITAPQYDVNVSGFAGTEQWVISDTAGTGGGLYNGGTMTVVANRLASPTQGISRVVAGNNGRTYYASVVNTGSQTLVTVQTYTLATNSFGPATTVSLGNIDQGGGGADFTAQQLGTIVPLDAGDGHLQNLAYANGFLYGVSEVKPIGSITPQVHWFKLDVSNPASPVLVAQGNVSGASIGTGVATFDGSIAVDQAGDVVINFTASGPNMYPADYYSFLAAGDPSSTFSAPVLYQASASYLANGDGPTVQRWGIYSTAIADPNHANSFWLSSEYSANGWWQTSVAQVAIQAPTSQITTLFSGISDTSTDPPHNALAVGPNYIVMAEGSRIEWTGLSGGAANLQSVYRFFGSLGSTAASGLFDPRAVYDSVNQRYVVTMDNLGSNGAVSNIDIAVSKDSNPNDGWYFYSLNTSLTINGQLTAADQPILSVDGTNIYITAPQYDVNVSGFAGTEQWVISDTAGTGGGLYNGGTMTVVANRLASPTQGISRVVAGNNGRTYYASVVNTGSQTLVTVQTYTLATNSFGPATTVSLGNIDQGGGGADFTAQQLGTIVPLDAGDGHLQNLAYANGFLYGVSEVKPIGSITPQVHWFKLDVSNPASPVLVAQGNVSGASIGTGVATFDGSIAVDQAGDVVINFTASGPNMYPADYYSFLAAGDPSSTFSAPVLYQASASYLANGDGPTVQRWGIYSTAIADPNHANSFWLSSEYSANGWWQTSVAQVAIQATTATSAPVTYTYQGTPLAAPDHVVVVVEENHSYSEIIGSSSAPYINSLAGQGTLFTNYYAMTHPSEPNYFVMFSGSTQGVTTDGTFFFPTTPTLAGELLQADDSFVGYAESPPDQDHDPWASFGDSQNTGQDFSQFPTDFSKLPTVSFVIPNINDDMHTGTIAQGDQWLSSHLGAYANWATTHNSILIVTFDEDDGTSNNHVATLVFGAGVGAGQNSQLFDHYSLLHTIENMYNLPALGSTGTAPIMTFDPVGGAPTVTSIATSGTGVADKGGNLAPLATGSLTVDEDNKPEAPILTIANTALTVPAGGSVALGITATPIVSDDSITVKISGLPSYETIGAPSGYGVSKALQSNGTYTWTISETSSTVGKPLTGLTLTSSYTGTGHPIATLTVTASSSTLGETASSSTQTMTVTDPPATTISPTSNLLALFNQYAAWGFHDGRASAGEIVPAWATHRGHDVVALLATPGHFGH